MPITQYAYTLMPQEDNRLPAEGLPCDGTVTILPSDAVCRALISFSINGELFPPQMIMNVPFQDEDKMALYMQYFVNDQARQKGLE